MSEGQENVQVEVDATETPSTYMDMALGLGKTALGLGETALGIFIDYFFYVVLIATLYQLGKRVYAYVMSLWVQGDLNEWVIITRNGELQQAGIGLSCFRGPFDSVAVFPSKLTKVEVRTQQVTQEMQGVQVNSMLEWTVDKLGNGPMKAFQNLALASGNFSHANDTLRDLTSAIVRHQIANSTIDTILKEREQLKARIMSDISEKAKGWGVHLATVEITDVRILSGSLFTNLQTQFREENNKKATIERLEVEDGIWTEQMQHSLTTSKREADARKVERFASMTEQLKKEKQELQAYKQRIEIQKKEKLRLNEKSLQDHQRYIKQQVNSVEAQLENKIHQTEITI